MASADVHLTQEQAEDLVDDFCHRLLVSAPDELTHSFITDVVKLVRAHEGMTSSELDESFRRAIRDVVLFVEAHINSLSSTYLSEGDDLLGEKTNDTRTNIT